MTEIESYVQRLISLKDSMESLRLDTRAKLQYHGLADAVFWSDEIPEDLDDDQDDALRALLRYRTTLILGEPEKLWKPFWDAGKQHFPNWIGFLEARVSSDPKVVSFYRRKAQSFAKDIDRIRKLALGD